MSAHGIGAGDINGDGRVDLRNGTGWWEQPSSGPTTPNGTLHAGPIGNGGAQMAVFFGKPRRKSADKDQDAFFSILVLRPQVACSSNTGL